jgi:hypothetical protein
MTYTKPRYEIGADGGLYRWSPALVDGAKQLLANYAKAQPTIVRNIIGNGVDMKVYPNNRAPVLRCMIESFTLRTWFAPWTDESGVTRITPVWTNTGVAVESSAEFFPSHGQSLWFFHDTSNNVNYVMWWDAVANKGYLPPFNNVFNDGRICMGPAWDNGDVDRGGPTMFDKALRARNYYAHETSSNADLSGSSDRTRAMLSFTPDTMKHDNVSCFGDDADAASDIASKQLSPLSGHIFDGFFDT